MRNTDTTNAGKRWKELTAERIARYNQNPKLCKQCSNPLPYKEHFRQRFCSRRCSGLYNNPCHPLRYCKKCKSVLSPATKGEYCIKCYAIVQTEDVIEKGLPMTPHRIRSYLIRVRGHRCEQCKLETWLGKPIPLDNHHKDGVWENNDLDNLELLCKNCHALTDSYGSKNIGNGRPFTKKCKASNIIVTKSIRAPVV